MDYYSPSGSGIVSYMLPVGLIIGTYTEFLRIFGIKTKYINTFVAILVVFVDLFLYANDSDPYFIFTLTLTFLLGIIVNDFVLRKIQPRNRNEELNWLETIFSFVEITIGIILIIVPHTNWFKKVFFVNVSKETKYFSYIVYTILGSVKKIFNLVFMKKFAKSTKQ